MRTSLEILLGMLGDEDEIDYNALVLATNPIAFWPLSETTGTVAADTAGGGYDGTYKNVTLNAITFPDGSPAPLFDATNERIALPVATLDTPFNPAEGSLVIWLKPRVPGVWTDGVSRIPIELGADANNRIFMNKPTANNRFQTFYNAGGVSKQNVQASYSPNRWFCYGLTWSVTADEEKTYSDGAQIGSTQTSLGTWSGALSNSFTAIGNFSDTVSAFFWDGYIKYVGLWDRPLTPAEMASLVPSSFLV